MITGPESETQSASAPAWGRVLRLLGPALGITLFSLAVWVLHRELRAYHYRDVAAHVKAIPLSRILPGLGLAALSYLLLTLYDVMGLRYAGTPLPYRKTAFASFVSYVFSNNLGFGLLTGGLVRYRLYTGFGLSTIDITRATAFCTATFWIGLLFAGGLAFTFDPMPVPAWMGLLASTRPLGALFLLLSCLYLAACAKVRRPLRLGEWTFHLPHFRMGLTQQILGGADWVISSSVLYFLLPHGMVALPHLIGIFLLAQVLGLASMVPGGLGVFESAALLMLSPRMPVPQIMGVLVVYRTMYYLLPMAAASLLFGGYELYGKAVHLKKGFGWVDRWMGPVAPLALSISTFLAGLVLLFSGATPSLQYRLRFLNALFPLPLLEASHFLGSLVGGALLLLARGLQERLDAAWVLSAILLAAGTVLSLLKGGDYEEALVLASMLLALLPLRRHFYRKASLSTPSFTKTWVMAICVALGSMLWLGFFSYKHIEYDHDLWWRFSLHANASRFLRSSVGVLALMFFISFRMLVKPAAPEPAWPGPAELDEAMALVRASNRTAGNLVLLGDKHILFGPARKAFIMYGVEGRSWVSLGDPVGDRQEWTELLWDFKEQCDRHAAWPVFYQVEPGSLPLYLDLGLSLLKLGEEARVPLEGFSLEGGARKNLRYSWNRLEKEGYVFGTVRAEEVAPLLPRLRIISDEWLGEKNTREKGFSLGRFDEGYLARFPLAVVRREGEIVAFANVWESAGKEELSVDLMRHTAAAPEGIMDFLFTGLLLQGSREGFRWFNLGMAPLSGIESRALAPIWNRLAGIVYRHGEHFYNFQGLRNYKEKFHPVWEPRFLASPGGLALPRILGNVSALISGGIRGLVAR